MIKEPRLLASMSHPNIVTVLTAEKEDGVFFIVMEYVTGDTLEHIIMRDGALELTRALDFSCQICNAVDHAHRAGILHRDLRPGNMLVSENGILKVTDFGTSRFLEIAAHGTTVIGSPPYMAPEQFHGKAVFASDVYSVGVTMYQMLTGSLPYDTPTPADLARLSRGDLVTAPRLKNPKIPKAINDIVLRALARGPNARYQRAADVLDDISGVSCTLPVAPCDRTIGGMSPRPTTTSPKFNRASKRGKRHRRAFAGTAASRFRPERQSVRSAARNSQSRLRARTERFPEFSVR